MDFRRNSLKRGGSRAWPVTGLLLVAAAVSAAGGFRSLENWCYDLFQRYQNTAPSDRIVLVTVDSRINAQKDIWSSADFIRLLNAIDAQDPLVVVATQPLRLPDVPGEEQLRALARLQQTASRSNSLGEAADNLTAQVERFQQIYAERQQLASRLSSDSGTLLAAFISDFALEDSDAGNCSKHAINLSGTDQAGFYMVHRARHLAVPPATICAAVSGVGFNGFWPDSDGVTREAALVLNANGVYLPSLAMTTVARATGQSNNDIVAASSTALMLNDRIINTGEGFRILNRYYSGGDESAFPIVSAANLLNGRTDPGTLGDKIVLIGETDEASGWGVATPISANLPPLEMVATSLSNLLEGDYLLRPEWLPLAEAVGQFILVALLAMALPALTTLATLLLSIVFVALLMAVEAWMLVAESTWIQLATVAVMTCAAIWTIHLWMLVTQRPKQLAARRTSTPIRPGEFSQGDADMQYALLREQAPTAETKEKMYELALLNLEHKEFARAERILLHIHGIDEGYRDVRQRLDQLGTARKKAPPKRKAANLGDGPDRRTLGRYEIDRVLGKGAMATVYLGRDPKINRKVAIKTIALAKEFDAGHLEDARMQFRREAESAGRLNHPNIIAIYDAGEDEDISYLAMEYFEGDSLVNHTQPGKLLPAKWVLELGARAAEALDYAHRQNVVHRDVKPANLMYHAATDTLKLTDFGIARLTDNSRTKTGIILGTPSYMAPEQLSASGVTGQSDLYSLGVTIYQLIAGCAPFRADSIPKLMDKIMNEPHVPLCELRDDIPACVDWIVNKAMAKDAADRFGNGRAMAMSLRDCAKQFES